MIKSKWRPSEFALAFANGQAESMIRVNPNERPSPKGEGLGLRLKPLIVGLPAD